MYSDVLAFFIDVIETKSKTLEAVRQSSHTIYFKDEQLIFSLKGLYLFLNGAEKMTFLEFKKMLYSSRLNQQLKTHLGQVKVYHSTAKIDSSLYSLENLSVIEVE